MSTRILFVCTGNSARSQMAEGLARTLAVPGVEVASAGTHPVDVNPLAVEAMRDRGIDISGQRSKKVDELPGEFDYVVTLCDDAAQSCPALAARRVRLHWSLPDPGAATGNHAQRLAFFRNLRDDIERRLRTWLAAEGLLAPRSCDPANECSHRATEPQSMVETDKLTEQIIGCAMEVHRQLGPGLLESTYEAALCVELDYLGVNYKRQLSYPVVYKGRTIGEYRVDLLVEDCVVVEVKSVERFDPVFESQLLTYLRVTGKKVGLLMNFNSRLLKDGVRRYVL